MEFLTRLRFDESGMKDLSGATWENVGVAFDSPGRFGGKAARFNGAAYLKTVNEDFNFEVNSDFTIAMWMKYSHAKNFMHQNLFGSYIPNESGKYVYCALYSSIHSQGIPCCWFSDDGNDRQIVSDNVAHDDNTWHYLAVTRSGNSVRMFVDGKLKSTNTSGAKMNFCVDGTTMIGWLDARNNDTYYYVGELDDICVIKDCALWTEDFVPPSTYLSLNSCLYVGNGVYGMKKEANV